MSEPGFGRIFKIERISFMWGHLNKDWMEDLKMEMIHFG